MSSLPREDSQTKEINKRAKEDAAKIESLGREMERLKKAAEDALSAQRDATGETVVTIHSNIFELEAKKHKDSAFRWLIAVIGVGAVLLAAAYESVNIWQGNLLEKYGLSYSLQLIFGKGIFFSTLLGGLTIAVRNHRAHRHNAVVNEHRHNALRTYSAFYERAKEDEQTKNAILLITTESIFSPSASGYLPKEEGKMGTARLMDIVNIIGKKTPTPPVQ